MAKTEIKTLRDFPSVEELAGTKTLSDYVHPLPRPIAVDIIRDAVADLKASFKDRKTPLTLSMLHNEIKKRLRSAVRREVSRVINATGIIVHTNLGRAPLSESIFDAIKKTVTGYGNIEFDIESGARGKRGTACELYLARLAGAEAATVVNNCAAALFVTLNTLANRKNVLISRGELVQIGGGFRIPDILKKSGARLCEVGTTNITSLDDYKAALDERTGLILKVHKSNFIQAGFTDEVPLKALVELGKRHDVPVFNDLGSGVFINTEPILGYLEPTVQQSVSTGADITSFSGDKMLGGSQAGLLVGRRDYIDRIKRNPIFRTLRVDKITYSILEKMLAIYLDGTYREEIALWRILSVSESELYKRGKKILADLGNPSGLSVEATNVYIGGGALPEAALPSVGIVFSEVYKPGDLMKKFRMLTPPVIGRVEKDRFILDLKAVEVHDINILEVAIKGIVR